MFRIISATVIFALAFGEPLALETCDSSVGMVENAVVRGCKFVNGKYILKRGTSASIEIIFDTEKDIANVNAVVTGIINGIRIPYPLPNPNGCTVLPCPLHQGGPYSYRASLPVSQLYPKITVDVEWTLQNEYQEVIACVRIPAKIE